MKESELLEHRIKHLVLRKQSVKQEIQDLIDFQNQTPSNDNLLLLINKTLLKHEEFQLERLLIDLRKILKTILKKPKT